MTHLLPIIVCRLCLRRLGSQVPLLGVLTSLGSAGSGLVGCAGPTAETVGQRAARHGYSTAIARAWPQRCEAVALLPGRVQALWREALTAQPTGNREIFRHAYQGLTMGFVGSEGLSARGQALLALLGDGLASGEPGVVASSSAAGSSKGAPSGVALGALLDKVRARCGTVLRPPPLTTALRRQLRQLEQQIRPGSAQELMARLFASERPRLLRGPLARYRAAHEACLAARLDAELSLTVAALPIFRHSAAGLLSAMELQAAQRAGRPWGAALWRQPLPSAVGAAPAPASAPRAEALGSWIGLLLRQTLNRAGELALVKDPRYRRLRAAARRYRSWAASAIAWPEVRPGRCAKTRRGCALPPPAGGFARALRRRLAAEGYRLPSLKASVEAFRRDHGLEQAERLDSRFFAALAVSATTKLQRITLNLHRLAGSPASHFADAIRINVPAFRLELWLRGHIAARHRVVVGQGRQQRCDEQTRMLVPAHATPLGAGLIDSLVFAPFWTVPPEIERRELVPALARDSLYLEKHGYERLDDQSPRLLRQLPGPHNALGFVKFLFDNPHQIFLHDTPTWSDFQHARRDLSHGCVRIEGAVGLAEKLLRWGAQAQQGSALGAVRARWRRLRFSPLVAAWDARRYEQLRRKAYELEMRVTLRAKMPLFIEYLSVEADQHGRVRWLPDIYGLDRQRIARPRWPPPCVPDSVRARQQFPSIAQRIAALKQRSLSLLDCVEADPATREATARRRALPRRLQRYGIVVRNLVVLAERLTDALTRELAGEAGRWRWRTYQRAMAIERIVGSLRSLTAVAERFCRR